MVITLSRAMLHGGAICTNLSQIEANLPVACRPIFRSFKDSLHPPADGPGCQLAVSKALFSVLAYSDSLGIPASSRLIDLCSQLNALQQAVEQLPLLPFARSSMCRRLAPHPAWAMLLKVDVAKLPSDAQITIGGELARTLATGKRFSKSFAKNLRLALKKTAVLNDGNAPVVKQVKSLRRAADAFFMSKIADSLQDTAETNFSEDARQWFRNRVHYAKDKAQQGVFHLSTQSNAQFMESAVRLRELVESGDQQAAGMCIGGLLALRADLVTRIPLVGPEIEDDWVIAIDVAAGTLHFAVSLFADNGAKPLSGASVDASIAASRIYVTPLPKFIANFLRVQNNSHPRARNLGELLPLCGKLDARTKTLAQDAILAPSFARFRNAFGPFSLASGADRLSAAIVVHDPRLNPTGKFYYTVVTREEVWSASNLIFSAMAWGPPVELVPGLAAGSQVTPRIQTLRTWFGWIKSEVENARPKDSLNVIQCIEFHNIYVLAIGSLLSLVLALRHKKHIALSAQVARPHATNIPVGDKFSGRIRAPRTVPLPSIARLLLVSYFEHVLMMDRLLELSGAPLDGPLRQGFRRIIDGDPVALLTLISRGRHRAVGTLDLETWWPADLGMHGNAGRHFVQNFARPKDLHATDIDHYLRHSIRGKPPTSSVSSKSLDELGTRLCAALNDLFREIGLHTIHGLRTQNGRGQ
jgi:hypothetical protein